MKKSMRIFKLFAAMLATVPTLGAVADVVPFGIFNSGMVLPRDRIVTVWGKADAGEAVTVAFAGQSVSTTADAKGDWSVQLAAMEANATGQTMTITGKNTVTLTNILVGDVWLCAGQSNMAMQYNDDNDIIRPYLPEADSYSMIRSINGKNKVVNFAAESPWLVAASNTLGKITLAGGEGAPGYNGGSGKDDVKCAGSGGGGMGAVGESATGEKSGNGGDGELCVITGLPIWYAGGGAGGSINAQYGTGGLGGGASATSGNGASGVNGLGGGGSGGSNLGTASGGKVRIEPEAASAAGFYRIVISKDPPQK